MNDILPPDSMLGYEICHFPDIPKLFTDFDLTTRQIDCLAFENKGKSAKESGSILRMGSKTYSNTLTNIRDKIRDQYRDIPSFIDAAEANSFLIKRFNNFQYIHKLNDVLAKFKEKNILNKKVKIYYKSDIPSHYVIDLEGHLKAAGFKIGGVYAANDKTVVDKNTVSLYIYTQGGYKSSAGDFDYDHVIETHVSGYVTSLFNFLGEYCDRKQVEEERIRHRLYIYDGVNYEYFPKDIIALLDDMKSGRYKVLEEAPSQEDVYKPLVDKFKEAHNKMKAINKLLPIVVYSSVCVVLVTGLYAMYPRPEDSIVLEQNLKIAEDILLNRDDLLNKVTHELSSKDSKIVALIGAGGAGKTTIARILLNNYRKENQSKIIFELNAETEESLYHSLSDMCYRLVKTDQDTKEWGLIQKASNQKDKNQSLVKFARRKLSETSKWLLVFDNVEELDSVTKIVPSAGSLYKKGRVLLTTRNQNIKSVKTMKSEELRCIDVGELSDQEKYKLFTLVLEKSTTRKYDKKEIEKFLERIPNYPLDVVSVACYLASSAVSIEEYQVKMKNMNESFDKINQRLVSEKTSYGKTRYGIVAVTLDKILNELGNKEVYKNLLLLISMCDSQNIPVKLLERCSSEDKAKLLLSELKKHSFISFKDDSLSIHRSIQEFWFLILKDKVDEKSFSQFMDGLLTNSISIKEMHHLYYKINSVQRNRKWYSILAPHLRCILYNSDNLNGESKFKYAAYILFTLASINEKHYGNHKEASILAEKAISLDKQYSVFTPYERAVLLGNTGYFESFLDANKSEKLLKEAVKLSYEQKDAEPLIIINSTLLGVTQIKNGNFEQGMETLNSALKIVPNTEDVWVKKLYVQVKSMITRYLLFRSVNNKKIAAECKKDFIDMLQMLDIKKVLSNTTNKEISGFIPTLNLCLAVAYNALEEYEEVSNIYGNSKFIYEHYSGTSVFSYLMVETEYALSLLRKGIIKDAYNTLKKACSEMDENCLDFGTRLSNITYLSESEIRQEKYKESINTALKIIGLSKKFKENKSNLDYSHCLYNAAFASYKLNKLDDARKYFGMFMKNIHELCGTLVSESECKRLESEGAFSEKTDIETYLLNAYKIYAAIFGKDHAFVKDYIRKNVQSGVPASSQKMPAEKIDTPAAIGA